MCVCVCVCVCVCLSVCLCVCSCVHVQPEKFAITRRHSVVVVVACNVIVACTWLALPYIIENQPFSYLLPNPLNISFDFASYAKLHLLLVPLGECTVRS